MVISRRRVQALLFVHALRSGFDIASQLRELFGAVHSKLRS